MTWPQAEPWFSNTGQECSKGGHTGPVPWNRTGAMLLHPQRQMPHSPGTWWGLAWAGVDRAGPGRSPGEVSSNYMIDYRDSWSVHNWPDHPSCFTDGETESQGTK